MKKVFIVHGFQGQPNGGWRPWLMRELDKKDVWACALGMPNPDDPIKDEWINEIARSVGEPNSEIFLVGHSLGSIAILRYLESLPDDSIVGGVILVSGPCMVLKPEDKDSKLRKIDHFLDAPINFDYLKQKSKNFLVIHGDNDERVPIEHSEIVSRNLGCRLLIIPNGGHLGGHDGFDQLPDIISELEKILN